MSHHISRVWSAFVSRFRPVPTPTAQSSAIRPLALPNFAESKEQTKTQMTNMAISDNQLLEEEKTYYPAIKKQFEMENEEEKWQPKNDPLDQTCSSFQKLSIKSPQEDNTVKPMLGVTEKKREQAGVEDSLRSAAPSDESPQDVDRNNTRARFVIIVPVEVTPEMSKNPESHCQKFLDLLNSKAFRKEDGFRYEDIAVVFGLNGMDSDSQAIIAECEKEINSEITFEKFYFSWKENNGIPYRKIREAIKNSEQTKKLVRHFRDNDPNVPIYFCFFDADTIDFNHVLSSYIDIIKEEKYPTVMSTGYLFPEDSEFRKDSEHDRQIRIITAKHFPLGTYYPEPNFCVLLPDGCDTLLERFNDAEDTQMNMESPVLIRQVKKRNGFSAVFANKNPVITPVPEKKQNHCNPRTWAISAYAHGELKVTEKYKQEKFGEEYKKDKRTANRAYTALLMDLLESDKMAQRIEQERPFEGPGAGQVFRAAEEVRKYLKSLEKAELKKPEELEEPEPEEPEELEELKA